MHITLQAGFDSHSSVVLQIYLLLLRAVNHKSNAGCCQPFDEKAWCGGKALFCLFQKLLEASFMISTKGMFLPVNVSPRCDL